MTNQGPLSKTEFDSFQSRRFKVLLTGCIGFAFAIGVAVSVNIFHVEPHPAVLGIGSFVCVISLMVQLFKSKCPRCDTTPMTTRVSLGANEGTAGSFVSVFPTKCSKCGVLFTTAHTHDADTE